MAINTPESNYLRTTKDEQQSTLCTNVSRALSADIFHLPPMFVIAVSHSSTSHSGWTECAEVSPLALGEDGSAPRGPL